MKKHLLPFILSFIPMLASAEAVAIEGIWYNLVLETNTAGEYGGSIRQLSKLTGLSYSLINKVS